MFKFIKFSIIFLIIFVACVWFIYNAEINNPLDSSGQEINFVINKGETVSNIAKNLADVEIIRSPLYFKIYLRHQKLQEKLQAGTYVLSSKLNIKEIVDIFINGKIVKNEIPITILEGWTNNDIAEYLAKIEVADKEKFLKVSHVGIKDFSFLKGLSKKASLEGYLFPDTYIIYRNASEEDIIIKMLINFDKKLTNEMRKDIKKQGKSIHEIITMASLIEKEVQIDKDMKIVSSIFWNRIRDGMRLESDATLTYLLNDKVAAHSRKDLEIDSPYNSYLYAGLPPTPIGSPGIRAIEAAIYPDNTNYYFFLTGSNGKTYFAKTYNEHLRNKRKYMN